MTDLRAELRRKWQEAAETERSGYEWRGMALDVPAPVKLLAAVREPDGHRSLILETPITSAPAAAYRFAADGVSVTDQRRSAEGLFRLAIVLEDDAVGQVFEVLAADVIEVAVHAASARAAIADVVRRLETWRACLKSRRLGLSAEGQVGLAGELIVLRQLAANLGYAVSIASWQGPLDGIHDFNLSGVAIEVKTVLGVGQWLHVSGFDQLETAGLAHLAVARPRLQETRNGTSLVNLVAGMREAIAAAGDPSMLPEFNERMMRAGYLEIDEPVYLELRFIIHDLQWYRVSEGFPRLIPSTVPAGIVDGTYVIDERALAAFRLDLQQVSELIQSMKAPHA